MPENIFISYSSKDRKHAKELTELLASAGFSVWIDHSGLDAAANWSASIVDEINSCSVFIVLLSANSIASHNVIKEVSLASEKRKKILPLDLEELSLPRELEYQLAGIHRAPIGDIGMIVRSLGKLGLDGVAAPVQNIRKEHDLRKSLMILPFEDLSPGGDNGWFADGIVSEMVSSLSHVKALRLIDAQTTKEFKSYQGQLVNYAKEMGIRYFVQGDVRKFGDQIKISSRLLDIETGDHLWQDSLKGTMDDIFDIQETVAKNVVSGLKIILTREEEQRVVTKPTVNTEAYELWLKGNEYFLKQTRADYEHAIGLYEAAIALDGGFINACISLAKTFLGFYRIYSREIKWIEKAREHITAIEAVHGETGQLLNIQSFLMLMSGNTGEALSCAKKSIEYDAENYHFFHTLGIVYQAMGDKENAVLALAKGVSLNENDLVAHFNYIVALSELGEKAALLQAAERALPLYERHLRLMPDDDHTRVNFLSILSLTGQRKRSLAEAGILEASGRLDGHGLYNLACTYICEGELEKGLEVLRSSVEKGFRNKESFANDPDLDPLRASPGFIVLLQELEEKIEKEKSRPSGNL